MIALRVILLSLLVAMVGWLIPVTGQAQGESVDKIIAVVGNEVILASELANQIQLTAFQTGYRPDSEEAVLKFQRQVLQQMISDKLFLAEALKDTTIEIRPSEVQQTLDGQIARAVQNFGSEEGLLEALASEGMTLRDLKRQYETDIENNLLRQRFIQQKLFAVSLSRYEVEKFYEEFKDSIPAQPEAMKLAHILLQVKPSTTIEDSVAVLAADLRQQILDGADFATISAQNSSLGAGENGGDLGYVERDDVVAEFSRAAFKLGVGDVSGVVRTQFGYHVIKCEGKRGDKSHLRHLLLDVAPSAADTAAVAMLADSLINEVWSGADFGEIAKAYSKDDDTRAQGGELGWFARDQMPADFANAVSGWTTPGECRGPVSSQFGLHLLKLLDFQAENELTIEDDYDKIKELARQDKTGRIVDEWIEEIKERSYIDYRMDELAGE